MIVYQVRITVDDSHADDFQKCMLDYHVQDVLNTGHFEKAFQSEDKFTKIEGKRLFIMQYHAKSAEDLKTYLKECAPKLRQEILEKYGEHMKAERTIMIPTSEFD